MAKPKVYVTRSIAEEALALVREVADLRMWPEKRLMPRIDQLEAVADCDGLLTCHEAHIDGAFLDACPRLRIVSNHAVGFDNVDVPACTARGVLVGNTPDVLSETTADLAFTLILATARRIAEMVDFVRQDRWQPDIGLLENLGVDVHHATLGILGLGRIGSEVAKRAAGFNMKVLYHDPLRNPEAEKRLNVTYVDLATLLSQSDFISIHVPLSPATNRFFGAAQFNQMKPTAILVNTARGTLVDREALLDALRSARIAGAGLDVTDPEPLRADDPLLSLPQVTILPHIGSATLATRIKMAQVAARNLVNGLQGKPLVSCVNPEAIGTGRNAAG